LTSSTISYRITNSFGAGFEEGLAGIHHEGREDISMRSKALALMAASIGVVVGIAGTSASAWASTATGSPIKVGAISALSGPITIADPQNTAKAYFKYINAHGGINGHPIDYISLDDAANPANAATDARQLVEQDGVVAEVGGSSLLECAVNANFYVQQKVLDIPGIGVDQDCFGSPDVSPVNTGPFNGTEAGLEYLYKDLHKTKLCDIGNNVSASYNAGVIASIKKWEASTGQKVLLTDLSIVPGKSNMTTYVLEAKKHGCTGVVWGLTSTAPQLVQAAHTQGINFSDPSSPKDVAWIGLTTIYSSQLATALGASGNGLMSESEFEPATPQDANAPGIAAWESVAKAGGAPISSTGEGGYVAAKLFVDVAKTIKGAITRASFTAAMHKVSDYVSPLTGTPYSFTPGPAHNSNRAIKVVILKGGVWQSLTSNWVVVPS
jgi:branched-chain amino acid transport system substrate-binding protein